MYSYSFTIVSFLLVDSKLINKEFLVSKTVVNCIPAWVRFAQCLRRYHDSKETLHLINAGKYASSMIGIISNSFMIYYQGKKFQKVLS